MRLIFVNRFFYPDISATSQMLTDAAFYLADRGHAVHVVTSRLTYAGDETLRAAEVVNGVTIHRIWTTRFGRGNLIGRALDYLSFYFSVFFVLMKLLNEKDTVIAKTDPPMVSVPVGWAAGLKRARHINWLQDLFPEVATELGMNMPGFLAAMLQALRDRSLLTADMNIAIGQQMRARLLKLGVYTDKVTVIPNWADGEAIQPGDAPNPLRDEWQLGGQFIVGYSGNLGRAHEIGTLLGAMEELAEADDVSFLFIGGGALLEDLKLAVAARGLKNTRFKPYQPRQMLQQSLTLPDVHLTILRSEMEGLIVPSKIYGVLAAGRASIFVGHPEGEVAQMLREAEAGIVVREGDVQGLVQAVRLLQSDADAVSIMGANARRLFDESLGKTRSLEKLEQVLV